ncbi:NAD(P)H-hydrate dehydratase [Zeimonas arvi]|uniref:Bifunctional NAD(P)H-hydrate repair enzyme n=1 Tax=Zeimonas arvi TaxID=2498847 RepID=A0A5C8P1W5_9BURK|nr:NAD(P)H-hydrate dehydratase [Zeimonas arvi]TXL67247.1 NAD(P)H-hydrate dehydratase [Zeimonas arvi]
MRRDHRPPHPLLRTASVRALEHAALAVTGPGALMDRAAAAVADAAERLARSLPAGTPVRAFCGPGNNGGDALLAAMMLRERGFDARAFELAEACAGSNSPADAARVREQARRSGMTPARIESLAGLRELLDPAPPAPAPLVLDGLFGIGLARPLSGLAEAFCRLVDELRPPLVAVDVPSGIDADTGAIVGGPGAAAVRATLTVTMIADKPGLRTGAALDHVGELRIEPLGVTGARSDGILFTRADAATLLPGRPRDSSKGSFGSVLVIGGAAGMAGAALLAGRAAQCSGAGKIWIASPDGPVFDPGQPQLMTRSVNAPFERRATIVAGCGLGADSRAEALLARILDSGLPMVLDADALNLLALCSPAGHGTLPVLTPHPLEAARLSGSEVGEIQADRIGAACTIAETRRAVVVLKGAGTVVAHPDGYWAIVDSGGPALATAGTGDVLAGLIGGLRAQGLSAWEAALLGCWAHGHAADRWAAHCGHAAGLSAAELPELARGALASLHFARNE